MSKNAVGNTLPGGVSPISHHIHDFPAILSSHFSVCCSELLKGHNDDLFDLYLARDSEVCRVTS